MNCKILLIDTPSDITLLTESIANMKMPVDIQAVTSIAEAEDAIFTYTPNIILIGSGKLMEDFEILIKVKDMPVVILCESDGFDVLLKNSLCNVLYITRPFDTDDIPEVFITALEFWTLQRKRVHNYSPKIKPELVRRLYKLKQSKKYRKPLTFYVNEAVEQYLKTQEKKVNSN